LPSFSEEATTLGATWLRRGSRNLRCMSRE